MAFPSLALFSSYRGEKKRKLKFQEKYIEMKREEIERLDDSK